MRWIVLIAAGALCVATGQFLSWNSLPDPSHSKTSDGAASTSSGSEEKPRVFAAGIIEGQQSPLELRFELTGRIRALRVHEGEEVLLNQVLAELETEACQLRLTQADAQLQIAVAERDKLNNGRQTGSFGPQSGSNVPPGQAGSKPQISPVSATSREDQNIATARVAAAEAAMKQEQLQLDKTRLLAPMDGTILAITLHKGELVGPSTESGTVTIVNRSRTRVRAFVEELDAQEVSIGQPSVVVASGQVDRKYSGTVSFCAPYVHPKSHRHSNPGERLDVRVREIIVDLDDGVDLLIGLPVEVFIETDHSMDRETAATQRASVGKRSGAMSRKKANSITIAP